MAWPEVLLQCTKMNYYYFGGGAGSIGPSICLDRQPVLGKAAPQTGALATYYLRVSLVDQRSSQLCGSQTNQKET